MNLMEQVSLYTASLPANLYHVLVLVGMTMNCANCLTASSSLRNCAKCHRASYCNKQCQGQHWGVHRHICKKGYKIVTTASQGKVLQSTGDFQPGNVIFQEKPLVLFTDNNQLLVQVLKSEDLYNELLQLFCPSKESFDIIHNQEFFKHIKAHPFFRILSMDAFKYRMWIPNSEVDETIQKLPETLRNKKDPSLIRQILLIERFNTIGLTSQKDGLFKVACRAEHSCSPNVHFMWDGSSLKCVALESIRQGQNLTYSYLPGEILERSKSKRQQHLVKYLFLCHCARCEKESF
ncbi:hypothetical protein BJ741DRAFT_590726 [Chytriomyces cf. hyalinus JEL632]|nr:hypothetical protein BJ741DRAFT_590726 [Chytriomyces cf. hyalinus JEL632]